MAMPEEWRKGSRTPGESPSEDDLDGASLVGTWFQTSRRCRLVARLPEGQSGIEALSRATISRKSILREILEAVDWALQLGEEGAGDMYLRCHAPGHDRMALTPDQFDAFRAAGGNTYR